MARRTRSDVDLTRFQKKVRLRQMTMEDYPAIVRMAEVSFPGEKPWTREQIESHLRIFPEGQIVVEFDGRVVASSSSVVIDFDEYATGHTWGDVTDNGYITNNDPQGDTLYGIEIMVDPEFRGRKLSRRLYDARKELCRRLNLKRIVIGGRLPGYEKYAASMGIREYVDGVVRREYRDPVMTAQLAAGFVLKRLITSYLPTDAQSGGYATLMEWVNLDFQAPARRTQAPDTVRICVVQYQMRALRNFDEFAQQCRYFVDVASGFKADFLLLPEIFTLQLLSFVAAKDAAESVRKVAEFTPHYLDLFSRLAIEFNVNVVGGSHFTLVDERIYNISYLFQRDGTIGRQYKLHVSATEKFWWGVEGGNSLEVFDTDRGKIAILPGYDIEFPELARIATARGARIVFVPFCTDDRQAYLRVRYCAQARCIENQIYSAIAGTVGNLPFVEHMDIHYAQSGIFTPSDFPFSRDAVAAECTPNIETVVVQDVDLKSLEKHRHQGTTTNWNDRRLDLYDLLWKSSPRPLVALPASQDYPGTPLIGEPGPGPLEKNDKPVAKADQEKQVNEKPGEPSRKAV